MKNEISFPFLKTKASTLLILLLIYTQQVKQFDRIKCPICRGEVRLLSGDVSTLPDTYFECLREMEKKMKAIQLKEMEKTRKIEEMKRKIVQQSGKINQLRWSNDRLAADCDELQQVNQHMETVVVAKDKQIFSLKKLVSAKKLEEAQNQKSPDRAQAERNEDLYFRDPEDILQLRDEDEENPLIDLLYPVDPSDSNEEWIDHEDYIEESNEEELRCMNAFEMISATQWRTT